MVCTLIVHVSLRRLAFKISTFVIRSSPSVTGSVNRVLLMMLYWFPNWITSQHSITTTQSVQQTVEEQANVFFCMFFKWCTVSNSEPQGCTVDKYCCIACWVFLSLLIKLVVPNYKRDKIRFLTNYRKSGLILSVGNVEVSKRLVTEQCRHVRDNPSAPSTRKCVLHSDNKELQIYCWCYIFSLFITLQMLNSCKLTTISGNIKRYSNQIKNNKKDTYKN